MCPTFGVQFTPKFGFQTTFLFIGLIELEWRYRFERTQAGSVALWCL